MRVIYVMRGALHVYPPCVAQICGLRDMGIDVSVVFGSCDPSVIALLEDRSIPYHAVGDQRLLGGALGKMEGYARFGIRGWNEISQHIRSDTVLWCGTADTAIALAPHLRRQRYVLNVLELYDTYPFYRRWLARLSPGACAVVASEFHRAWIMKSWWGLEQLPFVMPNKTYAHPRTRGTVGSTSATRSAIAALGNRRVLLYQGLITADRDLSSLAEALASVNSEYCLALMGTESGDAVSRLKRIYDHTVYLGYIPAPLHLEVTSHAHIGIANYQAININNVFCAPNKTYEYAGFGIPVLANDVPGLRETVGAAGAGLCTQFHDRVGVLQALQTIDESYEAYAQDAAIFFDCTDNNATLASIVETISRNRE